MLPSDALATFGQSFDFKYFNGTDYTDATFTYWNTRTIGSVYNSDSDDSDLEGCTVLGYHYQFTNYNLNTNASYITIDLSPLYSIINTSQIHSCIALTSGNLLSLDTYQSPQWDWVFAGSGRHFENSGESGSNTGYHAYMNIGNWKCPYVRADLSSQSITSGYSSRACFYGNTSVNASHMYLFIMIPYVDSGASGQTGTFTTVTTTSSGGGSTEINVNVDVDMSETNGILNTISSILSSIVDGIQGLFVPDSSWMTSWYESVEDTLDDVFGASSAASAMVEQAFTTLIQGTAVNSIYFPAIEIPNLSGGVVTLYAGGNVPLLPQNTNFTVASGFLGSASLYDYMKYLIDIVSTMAVINMVRTKLHAILVGEVVATNDGGDDE